MDQTILRSDVIKELDKKESFSMEFVTADRKRGTGGELIIVKDWKKYSAPIDEGKVDIISVGNNRHADHRDNKTVNIFNPKNRRVHIYKVHYRLIQMFNEKRVING